MTVVFRKHVEEVAAQAEPAPTGDDIVVLEAVRAHIAVMNWLNLRVVDKALVDRAEMGKAKYGTYLRVNNGRDATVDLYQELLDAIMYAMQARIERKPGGHLVELLLGLAKQVAEGIENGPSSKLTT